MNYVMDATVPDRHELLKRKMLTWIVNCGWNVEAEVLYSRFFPGITRRWRADFIATRQDGDEVAVIEIQGGLWSRGRHNRGQGYQDDLHKANEVQYYGAKFFAYTYEDLENETYQKHFA